MNDQTYTLDALCALTDLPKRTIRYYMQIGLVDRPAGETRAAQYAMKHLDQLLQIRKLTNAGISLDRIRDLLQGEVPPVPLRQRAPGSIEVCSHLMVADGIDIVIEPGRAQLSPEQVRAFIRGVMALHEKITSTDAASAAKTAKQVKRKGKADA